MKRNVRLLLAVAACLYLIPAYAQNVGINTDGSPPNPNAILDVKSTTQGVLLPRMSSSNRIAIPNTRGLVVYDTTTASFWCNTGTGWQMIGGQASGSGWLLSGNTGTDTSNFLGTLNHVPLQIKVNNRPSGLIDPDFGNTFWGYGSGKFNGAGTTNTAFGSNTLDSVTVGNNNTAVGESVLGHTTTGGSNSAAGWGAMTSNTTGTFNTAIGFQALSGNITGVYNTAVGYQALLNNTRDKSTAFGAFALSQSTIGLQNTATGYAALKNNVTGAFNVANGSFALTSNTSGISNTAVGANALQLNTTGSENTAAGECALLHNVSGSSNTAGGDSALYGNTTGSLNTAVGYLALKNNQSGNHNTAAGYRALIGNSSGSFNTAIGSFADVTGNLTNATAIGNGALVNASNKVRFGNSAVTIIEGNVPFTTPSDGRFKYNIREDVKGLDFILQLRPVTYQFDARRLDAYIGNKDTSAASYDRTIDVRHNGFIAQEVEKAASMSHYDFSGINLPSGPKGYYSLSYPAFVVPLVKAVQELNEKAEDLEKANERLKTLIQEKEKQLKITL